MCLELLMTPMRAPWSAGRRAASVYSTITSCAVGLTILSQLGILPSIVGPGVTLAAGVRVFGERGEYSDYWFCGQDLLNKRPGSPGAASAPTIRPSTRPRRPSASALLELRADPVDPTPLP